MDKEFKMTKDQNDYFFYKTQHPFSQWHKCSFEVDSIIFNCVEQYMMYKKAILFEDMDSSALIIKSENPREQKELGRRIKHFDIGIWNKNAKNIVYKGNEAKFLQNKSLLNFLLQTGDALIVEASPTDKIWGIGLSEENPDRFEHSVLERDLLVLSQDRNHQETAPKANGVVKRLDRQTIGDI